MADPRKKLPDAALWARRFHSRRIIHRLELAAQPDAELVLDGFDPIQLSPGFLAIPTPGHTRGHCVLLYQDAYLSSGDHLWWSRDRDSLHASRNVCWHDWSQQTASIALLRDYNFEWLLPGHGQRIHLDRTSMRKHLDDLNHRMRATS